ncbi:MAG: aldose 1-epimerase [Flavobacteriaceae bacterium]|nr:aldose 1-epimerase [Flavobacteriaceae bacterium]
MFTIEHINGPKDFILISDVSKRTCAKISLTDGASLQELKFDNVIIIENLMDYKKSFSSAILFPFTNRVQNGTYIYDNKRYHLDIKTAGGVNALHGFVYDKKFDFLSKKVSNNSAQITLGYKETERTNGFPYLYSIFLTYTIEKKGLSIKVDINNTDSKTFPFCIGWHPYFNSSNLSKSYIKLNTDKKLAINKNKIPTEIQETYFNQEEEIGEKSFDDCFILKDNIVCFVTPEYSIELESTLKENYLQLFTPDQKNCIAIEPMSAPSNSFNNKIGLQFLKADENFNLTWKLKFKN